MFRRLLLLLIIPLPLVAAARRSLETIENRHDKMMEQFGTGKERIKLPINEREYMLDDWGGIRDELADRAIMAGAAYGFDSLQNPFGGLSQGYNYAGSLGLTAMVRLDHYVKTCGLDFLISALYRSGTNLSERRIGNLFPVAELFGGETFRLHELYLKETLLDGKIVFKIGRLAEGNYFLVSPLYYNYVNSTFNNNPIAVFFNVPSYTSSSRATWGAYLNLELSDNIKSRWGIFNANSRIFENQFHGANFTFDSTEGIQLTTELEYIHNPGARGLLGHYWVGIYYLTGTSQALPSLQASNNYGLYLHMDQTIYHPAWAESKKGLTPWILLMVSPDNQNIFRFFTMGGFVFYGPLAWRPLDSLNFGYGYGAFTETVRQLVTAEPNLPETEAFGGTPPTYEGILELNYSIQVNPWLIIMPDIQYVLRPLGTGTIRNAMVIGLQLEALF